MRVPRRRRAEDLRDHLLPPRTAAGRRNVPGPGHRAADGQHHRRPAALVGDQRRRRQSHPHASTETPDDRKAPTCPRQPATRVDPITGAVIQGALENIAIEMGHKLMRMSYSSIIRESEDFGAALTDAEGRQLCECKMSHAAAIGADPRLHARRQAALRRARRRVPARRRHHAQRPLRRRLARPRRRLPACRCSTARRLIGFSVTTAHHLDIGAHTPGSCGIVDAVDTYAEGLQFKAHQDRRPGPPQRHAVWHMLRDNIRISDLVVGDMEAQIARRRDRRQPLPGAGAPVRPRHRRRGASEDLMDYSERLMRAAIRDTPGRRLQGRDLSSTASSTIPTRRGATCKIAVTITVTGDEIDGRSHRHRAAGARPADQHAVRRHGRLRDLADAALDPARQRRLRPDPAEQRA